ncbi:MAG: DUF2787 domain-containing protein [Gammaproteobacteria bacterium]|nr:DUF2787 domain-containing protein [Gammaproteobacteria bacterium]
MNINQHSCLLPISDALVKIIHDEILSAGVDISSGVVINFRDRKFSAETGGLDPVEIAVSNDGFLLYITDYSYEGSPTFSGLFKELDFDCRSGFVRQYGDEYPLEEASDPYTLWEEVFISHYGKGLYDVIVGPLL